MDGRRTTKRQYSEYSDFFLTQREPEYDQDTDLHQRESTHVRWGGQDVRRKPDSGLGYTQDYRSRWRHENCFYPDSVSQRTEQPASHECGAGDGPAGDRIPEEMDRHGDSRWDIPRKRPLFTSDGTDSMTFGSNTLESHADQPPEVEYSERLITDTQQGEGGTKRPCSSHIRLEMAVSQLQRDVEDWGAGKKPDSGSNPPTSEAVGVHIDAGSEILREVELGTVPRGVRCHCVFEWLGRCHGCPTAAIPSGRRCTQRSFYWFRSLEGRSQDFFDKVVIRTL